MLKPLGYIIGGGVVGFIIGRAACSFFGGGGGNEKVQTPPEATGQEPLPPLPDDWTPHVTVELLADKANPSRVVNNQALVSWYTSGKLRSENVTDLDLPSFIDRLMNTLARRQIATQAAPLRVLTVVPESTDADPTLLARLLREWIAGQSGWNRAQQDLYEIRSLGE